MIEAACQLRGLNSSGHGSLLLEGVKEWAWLGSAVEEPLDGWSRRRRSRSGLAFDSWTESSGLGCGDGISVRVRLALACSRGRYTVAGALSPSATPRIRLWARANHSRTAFTFCFPRTRNCLNPRLRKQAFTHSAVHERCL